MSNNKVFIVDVREEAEYQKQHIKGSKNIPLSLLKSDVNILDKLDKDLQVIIYCNSGNRAEIGCQIFCENGFSNTRNGININNMKKLNF